MILIIVLIGLLLSIPKSAHSQTSQQLTIQTAVKHALAHRPDLKALDCVVLANKSNAKSAMAGYYPTIGLSSDISQQKGQSTFGSETSIEANQLIYSFAGPQQLYKRAKNITAVSELEKVTQSNLIRLGTEKAFLQTWLIQEQERMVRALKKSVESTFKQQKHKKKLEQIDTDAWLKNSQDYAIDSAKIDQYQDDVHIAYKKLEFFMGDSFSLYCDEKESIPTHLSWQHKKKYSLKPLATYYHYALTSRPEIPQGLKRIAVEKWNIKLAQGARLPVITANAEAGCQVIPAGTAFTTPTTIPEIQFSGPRSPTIQEFWSIGISFRWALFDGLVTQYQEQQARANKTREIFDQEQTVLSVKQEVHEKYFECSKALKQLKAQKAPYKRNENTFKLMKQKLELGKISQTDFDSAQTTWQQAHFEWLTHNTTVALAERELIAACGYPDELTNNDFCNL